jgi:hypothetical protein
MWVSPEWGLKLWVEFTERTPKMGSILDASKVVFHGAGCSTAEHSFIHKF